MEQPELMQVKLTLTVADVAKDFVKELGVEPSERQVNILELIHLDSTISAKAFSEKMSEKMSEKESVTERTSMTNKNSIRFFNDHEVRAAWDENDRIL